MNKVRRPRLDWKLAAMFFSVSALLLTATTGVGATYRLDKSAKNRVEFQSKATLESFGGKAKQVTAEFELNPADLKATKGTVTVDLRSLDTGIELRNKHMRENHLQTDSFPNAVFVLDSVRGQTVLAHTGSTPLTVHGTMTMHGTKLGISAPGTVQPGLKPGTIRLQTEFPLKITEYRIPRPEFLFLKLAEEVKIIVDLTVELAPE